MRMAGRPSSLWQPVRANTHLRNTSIRWLTHSSSSSPSSSSPFDPTRLAYLSQANRTSEEGKTAEQSGIFVLTLNRPKAANAISTTLLSHLHDALTYLRSPNSQDESSLLRTLIIRSSAPGIFCAGADLKERATMSIPQVDSFLLSLRSAMSNIESLPVPVIAALDGLAMGGGLELALCADIRVGGPRATRLGLTEAKLGIIPGAGGTQRLTRLLGPSKAKDLIFSGRLLDASQAFELGLVDHLAKGGEGSSEGAGEGQEAYRRALELATEMSQNGPLALRAAKLAIDKGSQMDIEAGLDFERECYEQLFGTEDRLEGLRAFKEKRKPKYIGR
ncbi:hypothetical protein CF326_g1347 [Tilletia indica]|uniref:Enoyl-CoA hydratase n=1 Tax=Tilletia indica TaxID=43049 RepID=A0A177TRN3_9BASI|nr:hypothetical protein CF326_g1347 [Tilletia indica]KAE8249610.1 hypothetical protein A4X13_0g5137 [Tilletia indica]